MVRSKESGGYLTKPKEIDVDWWRYVGCICKHGERNLLAYVCKKDPGLRKERKKVWRRAATSVP